MTSVLLRPERPTDRQSADAVQVAAFGERGAVVRRLLQDLRDVAVAPELSIVAAVGEHVVGHVLLTACLIDTPRRLVPALVLSPLAVEPRFQRQGIGARLVRAALEAADRHRAPAVLLEGDPAYYSRFGFVPGRDLGLRRPSLRIPEVAFQAHPLRAYESWMTGTLVYPDVWWRHDVVGLREPPAADAMP